MLPLKRCKRSHCLEAVAGVPALPPAPHAPSQDPGCAEGVSWLPELSRWSGLRSGAGLQRPPGKRARAPLASELVDLAGLLPSALQFPAPPQPSTDGAREGVGSAGRDTGELSMCQSPSQLLPSWEDLLVPIRFYPLSFRDSYKVTFSSRSLSSLLKWSEASVS